MKLFLHDELLDQYRNDKANLTLLVQLDNQRNILIGVVNLLPVPISYLYE